MTDGATIRHPDIIVTLQGKVWLVVEMDGSWHDTVAGRRQTDRRDRDYRLAGLDCIAIRESEYPGDAWKAELERRVKEWMDRSGWNARIAAIDREGV